MTAPASEPLPQQLPPAAAGAAPVPVQPAMSPPPPVSPNGAGMGAARPGPAALAGQRIEVPSGQQLAGGQRLESVGQRPTLSGQRLESLAGADIPLVFLAFATSVSGLTKRAEALQVLANLQIRRTCHHGPQDYSSRVWLWHAQELRACTQICKKELVRLGGGVSAIEGGCVGAGNVGSMMASSNNTLDNMRALGSISSGGVVPAAMQLAQRGAMAGYPAAMLQQQYLSSIPWLLRMQARHPLPRQACIPNHGRLAVKLLQTLMEAA